MKTKIIQKRWVILPLMTLFLCFGLWSCRQKGSTAPDPVGGCDFSIGSDGLYNCTKTKNCTGHCVMQIKNGNKPWRDVPGGNVNPDDLKATDTLRCTCDTTKKKTVEQVKAAATEKK